MTGKHRFQKTILFYLALVLIISGLLPAQEAKRSLQTWKVDDVINQERASDFRISPEGSRVVWIKNTPDKERDGRVSHLFLSYLDREEPALQLTRGTSSESQPRWSPDGQRIAFLSSRAEPFSGASKEDESKGRQLWLLDLRGGEPWKVTNLEFGVIDYDWVDSDRFLILAREPKTLQEIKGKEKKDDSIVYEDQEHMIPQRLFIYCLKEKTWHRLTENHDQIRSFELSPIRKWWLPGIARA